MAVLQRDLFDSDRPQDASIGLWLEYCGETDEYVVTCTVQQDGRRSGHTERVKLGADQDQGAWP